MQKLVQIQPLEPIISRDGRPFDKTPGITAFTYKDLSPSMIAGTIRTIFYKNIRQNKSISAKHMSDLMKTIKIRGPIYERNGMKYFPVPEDMYIFEDKSEKQTAEISIKVKRLVPQTPQQHAGETGGSLGIGKTGLHEDQLCPVQVPSYTKPWSRKPAYISEDLMLEWLFAESDETVCIHIENLLQHWNTQYADVDPQESSSSLVREAHMHFLAPFPLELRNHTAIDSQTQVAQNEHLFSTQAIALPTDVTALVEVATDKPELSSVNLSTVHSMGGKRRLASFQEISDKDLLDCPESSYSVMEETKYVRMVLTTPAFFTKGWRPDWLDEHLQTNDKWEHRVKLQLIWACISGSTPYSGWSYSSKEKEKAIRRMVPAGSVYFFKVMEGNPKELLENMWLTSVSDHNRRKESFDREDGFGLALWGNWQPSETKQI